MCFHRSRNSWLPSFGQVFLSVHVRLAGPAKVDSPCHLNIFLKKMTHCEFKHPWPGWQWSYEPWPNVASAPGFIQEYRELLEQAHSVISVFWQRQKLYLWVHMSIHTLKCFCFPCYIKIEKQWADSCSIDIYLSTCFICCWSPHYN